MDQIGQGGIDVQGIQDTSVSEKTQWADPELVISMAANTTDPRQHTRLEETLIDGKLCEPLRTKQISQGSPHLPIHSAKEVSPTFMSLFTVHLWQFEGSKIPVVTHGRVAVVASGDHSDQWKEVTSKLYGVFWVAFCMFLFVLALLSVPKRQWFMIAIALNFIIENLISRPDLIT